VGVIGLADDLEVSGTGLLLAVIGLALAWHGASVGRRATCWIGGAAMALGLAVFLADMAGDDATTGGMLFVAGGIAMVFGGHLLGSLLHEVDELAVTSGVLVASAPDQIAAAPSEASLETDASPADPDALWRPPVPPASSPPDDPPAPPPPS
jgi:hypothetical protein